MVSSEIQMINRCHCHFGFSCGGTAQRWKIKDMSKMNKCLRGFGVQPEREVGSAVPYQSLPLHPNLHYIEPYHYITYHCISLLYISLHIIPYHYISLTYHYTQLHFICFHNKLHCIALSLHSDVRLTTLLNAGKAGLPLICITLPVSNVL